MATAGPGFTSPHKTLMQHHEEVTGVDSTDPHHCFYRPPRCW